MAKRKRNVPLEDARTKQGLISNGNKNDAKMMKKRKRNFCQLQIPEDIIFNVLKRLPAKSLMRFKTVCKAWQALICDPYFAKSHYNHCQSRPDSSYFLFYVINDDTDAQAVFPTNSDGVFSSQLPVQIFDGSQPCTNIVNGLICLWDFERDKLELLNLTTGEKIALPRGKSMPLAPSQFFRPSYFLGFDPLSKQYKVLYFSSEIGERISECYVIPLGNKSWRKITHGPQHRLVKSNVSVNGAIYWKDKIFWNGERFVQFFDVREEKFLLLSVPTETGNYKELEFMAEVGGNLALGLTEKIGEITLWTLKNHDQVWVKARIKLPGSISLDIGIIGSTRSGEILLTSKGCLDESWADTLIFYHLRKRRKFRTRKITLPRQPNSISVLLSFLSLAAASHHVENIMPLKLPSEQKKSAKN